MDRCRSQFLEEEMTRHYEDPAKPPFFKDSVTVTRKTGAGIKPHEKAAIKEKTKGIGNQPRK